MTTRQRRGQRHPNADRSHECDHEGCPTLVSDPAEKYCDEHTLRARRKVPCKIPGCPHPASSRNGVCLWHWQPEPEPEPESLVQFRPLPMGTTVAEDPFELALCVPCPEHKAEICEPCHYPPFSLCGERVRRAMAS